VLFSTGDKFRPFYLPGALFWSFFPRFPGLWHRGVMKQKSWSHQALVLFIPLSYYRKSILIPDKIENLPCVGPVICLIMAANGCWLNPIHSSHSSAVILIFLQKHQTLIFKRLFHETFFHWRENDTSRRKTFCEDCAGIGLVSIRFWKNCYWVFARGPNFF